MTINMNELLKLVFDKGASDLHISVGLPPVIRVDGKLIRLNYEILSSEDLQHMVYNIMSNEQRRFLEQNWEIDFSYTMLGIGRFRVNVYKERGFYAAALRTITTKIPSLVDLKLPTIVKDISDKPRGLVLVTGPTGSGKSTTLAAMIDYINTTRSEHILTIEDPTEFVHTSKKSVVHQRELGADTRSFSNALRSALREDPDVILVGEMRDLETIGLALTAAETGHLVFGTLHTSSASQTIDRVVDVFPAEQQQQVRVQLSTSLVAVFSQTLLPKLNKDGLKQGRVLAQEIMLVTPAIANLIRESKTAQLYSSIQMGTSIGMQSLEGVLKDLYMSKQITLEDALSKSSRPEDLKRSIMGGLTASKG